MLVTNRKKIYISNAPGEDLARAMLLVKLNLDRNYLPLMPFFHEGILGRVDPGLRVQLLAECEAAFFVGHQPSPAELAVMNVKQIPYKVLGANNTTPEKT